MKRLLAKGISIVIIVSLLLSNGWFLPIYVYAQEATQSAQGETSSTPAPTPKEPTPTPTAQPAPPEPTPSLFSPAPSPSPTPTPIPTPTPTPAPLGTPASSPFASDIPFEPSEQPPPLLTPTILPMQTPTGTISPTLTVPNPSAPSASIRQRRRMARLSKKTFMRSESIRTKIYNGAGSDVKIELNHEGEAEASALVAKEIIDGELIIRVDPPASFKPGKYTLRVSDELGEVAKEEFSWGVLAINTNKSIYTPNEQASLAMAVLDEFGNMVCDAKVQLTIKNPVGQQDHLSTENGKITVNPECTLHAFTLKPDYEATYQTGEAGIYAMSLTAETKNGAQTITDSFAVQASVPFDVERVSATRIYPPVRYPVSLQIVANEDFTGTIEETVPAVFEIFEAKSGRSYDSVELLSSRDTPIDLRFPLDGILVQTLGFGEKLKDSSQVDIYQKFGLSGHDGVDYDVPMGTPVLAADGGLVVLAGAGAYGTTVVVDHPWGRSYYGHLSETTVTIGQKVLKGQELGLSGNTGLSTGAHLHFGIKPKNNDMKNGYFGKVDPLPYLAATRTATFSVKVISWNITLNRGERITLGYEFDAPDVSPQYYLLGPLVFGSGTQQSAPQDPIFREARQWQIAADAIPGANIPSTTATSFPMQTIDPQLFAVPSDYPSVQAILDQDIARQYTTLKQSSASPSAQLSVTSSSRTINWIRVAPLDATSAKGPTQSGNSVLWQDIKPGVPLEYQTFDGYLNQILTLPNDGAEKTFTFRLDKSDNLTIEDYFGHVLVKDKDTQEELFFLRFPQGIDAQNQRIDYKYEIQGDTVRLYPNRSWQLGKAVYPIKVYAPINVIAWNEATVQVGENCPDPGCGKDGDVSNFRPAGWYWGVEEKRVHVQVKVPKMKELERREYESVTNGPPDNEIDAKAREDNVEEQERKFSIGGLHRYGIDYTLLAKADQLAKIRDKSTMDSSPILDAKNDISVVKKKTDPLESVIPVKRRLAYKPARRIGLLTRLFRLIVKPVSADGVTVKTIGSAGGRNFSSIATWESTQNGDLVAAGALHGIQEGDLYKDSNFSITAKITIDGSTTDSTHYMMLTAPSSERHTGVAGTGVVVICGDCAASPQDAFALKDNFTRWEWFEISGFKNGGSSSISNEVATSVLVQYLLIHDFDHATGLDRGISESSTTGTSDSMTIRNTIIYDGGNLGFRGGNTGDTATIQNVTIYGMVDTDNSPRDGIGITAFNSGVTVTVNNVISMNNNRSDIFIVTGGTCDFVLCEDNAADCAAGDVSLTCTNSLTNKSASTQFVSTTAGSEDFHLKTGSDAIDTGTDLSGSFTTDIDNTTRTGTWDIGADEFVVSGPTNDQLMRHGNWFTSAGVEQAFTF